MHWIQVVQDNDANVNDMNVYGQSEDIVDNGGANTPFYDVVGKATSSEFYDYSWRPDPGQPISWGAELALVRDMGPNGNGGENVTVYEAVDWGWITAPQSSG